MMFVDRDAQVRRSETARFETKANELAARWYEPEALRALGSCTLNAVSDHADARGWDLGYVTVETSWARDEEGPRVVRLVEVGAALDDDQHSELTLVCRDTPVTREVAREAEVATLILDDALGTAGLIADEVAKCDADEIARREAAIDETLRDSFPASDPPSWTCCG